ncbi:hypothetical protein RJZ56_004253 [Blastomyces dermatitidis]
MVWEAAKDFLHLAITHTADATTTKKVLQDVVEPSLNELLKMLNSKTSELLAPHRRGHPITYNHYFTETYQKTRNERQKAEYATILKDFFSISSLDTEYKELRSDDSLHQLLDSLVERTEPDMRFFAASEALDYMMAYYKVALKRFIDDVAIEIIEMKLVSALGALLSPITVFNMPDDIVTRIAGESEEHRAEREELNKQLDILAKGAFTCKQFIGNRGLFKDLEGILQQLHSIQAPTTALIGAVDGGPAVDVRARHAEFGGPFRTESEFNNWLVSLIHPESKQYRGLFYIDTIQNCLRKYNHQLRFAHGDLGLHNILVSEDGMVTAIIDWEFAGWYPEYWEYIKMIQFSRDPAFRYFARGCWKDETGDQVFFDEEYVLDQMLDSQVRHGERVLKRPR